MTARAKVIIRGFTRVGLFSIARCTGESVVSLESALVRAIRAGLRYRERRLWLTQLLEYG